MNAPPEARRLSRVEAAYAGLLELYPADFRRAYAEEMLRLFSENWQRVESDALSRRWGFCGRMLGDWSLSMGRQWGAAANTWEFILGFTGLISSLVLCLAGGDFWSVFFAGFVSLYSFAAAVPLLSPRRASLLKLLVRTAALGTTGYLAGYWLSRFHSVSSQDFTLWPEPLSGWAIAGETTALATGAVVTVATYFRFIHYPPLRATMAARAPYGGIRQTLIFVSIYPGAWSLMYPRKGFAFGELGMTFLCATLGQSLIRLWVQAKPHNELRTFE
jgi:hypothetical protein